MKACVERRQQLVWRPANVGKYEIHWVVALATMDIYAGRRVGLLYDDHLQVAAGSANAGMRRRSCGRLVTGGEAN